MLLQTISKTRFRMLIFGAPLAAAVYLLGETAYLFATWETTTGKITRSETKGSGRNRTNVVSASYKADQREYSVDSSAGTMFAGRKGADIAVLYKPTQPADSVIKFRHGQLGKMFFCFFLQQRGSVLVSLTAEMQIRRAYKARCAGRRNSGANPCPIRSMKFSA